MPAGSELAVATPDVKLDPAAARELGVLPGTKNGHYEAGAPTLAEYTKLG